MPGGALDEVAVLARLNPDAILVPVVDPGLGVTLGRVAPELYLLAQLHILAVGWGVKLPSENWKVNKGKTLIILGFVGNYKLINPS